MPPPTLAGFYWHYVREVWPVLAALMAIGLVISLIEVSIFRYVGAIVDMLKTTTPDRVLADYGWTFAWMAAVVVIGRPIATIIHDLLVQQSLAPSFTNLVRWQTHRYVLRQTVGFFTNDFAGRIASKIIQTGPALRESAVQVCDALWFVTIYAFSSLVLFGQLDAWLTVPLAVWIGLFVFVLIYFVPRIRKRSVIVSEARSMLTGRIVDSYTNIQTVKLFAHTAREDDYARDAVEDHLKKFRHSTRLITAMSSTVVTMNGLLIAGTTALSVWLWMQGILSLGDITIASGLAIRIATMSGWIMWTSISIFDNVGAVQEGMETIARPQDLVDAPDAMELKVTRGEIRFENVTFHYGKKSGIIENLSLTIKPGEKVGLVGRSGAGKSTIANLLLRFYDVEGGRIVIDGQDIAQVSQDSLRKQIGLITQDTSLLHRSIRENVLYGRPDAGEDAMRDAIRQAHADRVRARPFGPLGQAGVRRACRRARREALGRPAPTRRHRPRAPQGCADPRPRRSDVGARLGGGSGDPGELLPADGRQDGDRHRPSPLDHRRDGSPGRARPWPGRRDGQPRRADPQGRPLRVALDPPIRRLPRRNAAGRVQARHAGGGIADERANSLGWLRLSRGVGLLLRCLRRAPLLLDVAHRKDRDLVEQDRRQREADLADRVGRRQHRGDDEGDDDRPAALAPSAPPTRRCRRAQSSVRITGSWKTRPKAKISVMISPRYSFTLGSSSIDARPGPPCCSIERKNFIASGITPK